MVLTTLWGQKSTLTSHFLMDWCPHGSGTYNRFWDMEVPQRHSAYSHESDTVPKSWNCSFFRAPEDLELVSLSGILAMLAQMLLVIKNDDPT